MESVPGSNLVSTSKIGIQVEPFTRACKQQLENDNLEDGMMTEGEK